MKNSPKIYGSLSSLKLISYLPFNVCGPFSVKNEPKPPFIVPDAHLNKRMTGVLYPNDLPPLVFVQWGGGGYVLFEKVFPTPP